MSARRLLAFLVVAVLAAPTTLMSAVAGADLYLSSVGRMEGDNDSRWFTTVWVHNPSSETVWVTVSLLRRNRTNPTPEQRVLVVGPNHTLTYEDFLYEVFDLERALGALRFQTDGTIAVAARVFNLPGDDLAESQGQVVVGLPSSHAIARGESTDIPGISQPADGSFRCNFGLVETAGGSARVAVTLVDDRGIEMAASTFDLDAFEPIQKSLASLDGETVVDGGRLHVEVLSGEGRVLAVASVVGNGVVSQDPSTLEMWLDPKVVAGGGGDITAVIAGPGLTGGGNEGDVSLEVGPGTGIEITEDGVGLAVGGVTGDRIAAGHVVRGLAVDGEILREVVTLEAGDNVSLSADGNTVVVEVAPCFGTRLEVDLESRITASVPGAWQVGADTLSLPSAGRWRVGYRVLQQLINTGVAAISAPVQVALYDVSAGSVIERSLVLTQLRVEIESGLGTSQALTVAGDAVVETDQPVELAVAVRTSRGDLRVVVHPDGTELASSLPAPFGASFLWAECLEDLDDSG